MLLWLWSSGCTLAIDPSRPQCRSRTDCEQRGPAFENALCVAQKCVPPECSDHDGCPVGQTCQEGSCEGEPHPDWTCVGMPPEAQGSVTLYVPTNNVLAQGLPFLEAEVCTTTDSLCETPLKRIQADEEGVFTVEIDANFPGYLKPDLSAYDGVMPAIYFLSEPPVDGIVLEPFLLPTEAQFQALFADNDVPILADRGHVMINVVDCHGELAPGVYFESRRADDKTVPFYSSNAPSRDLTETQEPFGHGGFANFPTGTSTVYMHLRATGQLLGKASVVVRPGTLSLINFELAGYLD